tara:strand:- start:310 stop:468 length:159 start_codon:yes stop_codon:yes gene_type:complete
MTKKIRKFVNNELIPWKFMLKRMMDNSKDIEKKLRDIANSLYKRVCIVSWKK